MYAKMISNVLRTSTLLASLLISTSAAASGAQTSATATSIPTGPGTAAATASYEGDRGFARTQTRTGEVNQARAVAVGVDEDGLTVSISHAFAPRTGPAFATNLSFTFGRGGDVAQSAGQAHAQGGFERSVTAGGQSSSGRGSAVATSLASGRANPGGIAHAKVVSEQERGRERNFGRRVIRLP